MHSKMLWEKHFPFLVKSWLIMSVVEFRAAYQRKRAVTRAAFLTFLTFENAFESENCRKREKIPTSKNRVLFARRLLVVVVVLQPAGARWEPIRP
jgi:hypothetical protein